MSKPRRFYKLLVTVGLALYLGAFFGQTRLAALPGGKEAVLDLAYPVTMGGYPAGSPGEVQRLAEAFPAGREVTIVDAGGARHAIRLVRAFSWIYLLVTCLSGLLFWSVAAFVFAPRIKQPAVPYFFWCTFLYGWAIMIGGVYFPRPPEAAAYLFNLAQLGCLALLPLLFVHLTLHFPRPVLVLPRLRRPLQVLGGIAVALVAWQAVVFARYYASPGPGRAHALRLPENLAGIYLVALVAIGFVILTRRGRSLVLTREKNQVKWLLWGFLVGVTPFVFLRTLLSLLGITPPLVPIFDRIFELAIPLAFVSAVVFFRLFDIDLLIRRSLIYALLAAAFALFNIVIGFAIARWVLPYWPGGVWLLLTAMGLIAGISFRPLRSRIGLWVDRVFFKIRHDHDQALNSFRHRIEESASCPELAERLVPFLQERLGPARTAVILHAEELVVAGDMEGSRAGALLETFRNRPGGTRVLLAAPDVTSLPELESEDFPSALAEMGFVLIQPVPADRLLAGALLLGPKETQWRYVEPDLLFLADLARATGDALGRIALVRRVAEEAIERRRLDELNRLKSDFLSRVSHDLRTPLTSIAWSTQNLLDGLAGPIEADQKEYLETVRTSAAHLNRMVANLLEISRLELARTSLEVDAVDLEAVLRETASMLRPILEAKNVTLRIQTSPETIPPVRADRGKLLEVAMNLLDNAVKYTPPGTEIEVRIGAFEDGRPGFLVRDRGPGLDPTLHPRLFHAFQQGAESPYSSQHGFGLGLYISRTYVDLFGGSLEAANHPEGGAEFVCSLLPFEERSVP